MANNRVREIECEIAVLALSDLDARLDLLRERNRLLGGNVNALDVEILVAYYGNDPLRPSGDDTHWLLPKEIVGCRG